VTNRDTGGGCRVVQTPHEASFGQALVFRAGDGLMVEDRQTNWDGWLWCVGPDGVAGWAPAIYVDRDGSRGVANRDYDATELTVAAGEILTVHYEEAEWAWCTRSNGENGWAPAECLALVAAGHPE
jgi:hypothetical protein